MPPDGETVQLTGLPGVVAVGETVQEPLGGPVTVTELLQLIVPLERPLELITTLAEKVPTEL